MTKTISIATIGYGEVGQLFARQWLARPGVSVNAFDLKLQEPALAALWSKLPEQTASGWRIRQPRPRRVSILLSLP